MPGDVRLIGGGLRKRACDACLIPWRGEGEGDHHGHGAGEGRANNTRGVTPQITLTPPHSDDRSQLAGLSSGVSRRRRRRVLWGEGRNLRVVRGRALPTVTVTRGGVR